MNMHNAVMITSLVNRDLGAKFTMNVVVLCAKCLRIDGDIWEGIFCWGDPLFGNGAQIMMIAMHHCVLFAMSKIFSAEHDLIFLHVKLSESAAVLFCVVNLGFPTFCVLLVYSSFISRFTKAIIPLCRTIRNLGTLADVLVRCVRGALLFFWRKDIGKRSFTTSRTCTMLGRLVGRTL